MAGMQATGGAPVATAAPQTTLVANPGAGAGPVRDLDAIHMTQVTHAKYLRDGREFEAPLRSGNCGVVSAIMALRLVGLDVPGFAGERTQDVVRAAKVIAQGSYDGARGTRRQDIEAIVTAAGGTVQAAQGSARERAQQAMAWARAGDAIVLSGNSSAAWGKRFESSEVSRFDGRHSVLLSYDVSSGTYQINDPLSKIGAFATTPEEILAYMDATVPGDGGGRVGFVGDALAVRA